MSKVALVVGGTGGLGAACAEDLANDHNVVIAGRNLDKANATIEKVVAGGGQAAFIAVDILDAASIASMHKQVLSDYGRLDVALNAHGVLPSFLRAADVPKEEFENCMAVNVTGTHLCMAEQIRATQKNAEKGGVIVNFTSIYGLTGTQYGAAYAASKHALVGLTRSAAVDYARDNIRISAVAPGVIPTEITFRLDPSAIPDADMKAFVIDLVNHYPQKRFGEVTDCSRAVRYLVESPWTTGAVLEIDGGFGATR